MKFYPLDWRGDPRLRICSFEARGLWIDLMSYMHEGQPYGHLTLDGMAPDTPAIASLMGRPLAETRRALAELESRQVFSRTEEGVIYSRRMVRDKAKADRDRLNGKGGGNPILTGEDNRGVNPPLKAHMPEARELESERKEDTADAVSAADGKYVFSAGIVRLTKHSFDQWKRAYSYLELEAEILARVKWATEQGSERWYPALSAALARRNAELKAAKEAARDPQEFKWRSGIEGVV